jgi:hypothetical protein
MYDFVWSVDSGWILQHFAHSEPTQSTRIRVRLAGNNWEPTLHRSNARSSRRSEVLGNVLSAAFGFVQIPSALLEERRFGQTSGYTVSWNSSRLACYTPRLP